MEVALKISLSASSWHFKIGCRRSFAMDWINSGKWINNNKNLNTLKALRNYLNKIKPNFEGRRESWRCSFWFEGFESFMYVPNATSKSGVHIHWLIDSKRTMTVVIIALLPALLLVCIMLDTNGYLAIGSQPGFWMTFVFGLLAVLPQIIVSYVVSLGIEFTVAQWKKRFGRFLVSGILIPMIVPVDTPLWMIAVATAFAVIFAKGRSSVAQVTIYLM